MSWSLTRFDYLVTFAGASHAGNVRPNNEDAWRIDPTASVFVVADGMGGHAAGERASRLAVDSAVSALQKPDAAEVMDAYLRASTLEARRAVSEKIRGAVNAAHEAVRQDAVGAKDRKGMGCTLDLAVLLGEHAFVAHVGDGRTYVVRPATTIQLTHDHTLAQALVQRGVATPSKPPTGVNALTNAIGREGKLVIDEVFVDLEPRDRIVLCSDGVHGEVKEEALIAKFARQGTPEEAAVALVKAALERGGKDNATALVIDVGQRRLERGAFDGGVAARDASFVRNSPLFTGLSEEQVVRALSAAIEMQFEQGADIPRFSADDRVGYIVLEGTVTAPGGWSLGPSSVVYPESLAGGGKGNALCKAATIARVLRIRADDFKEVCASDTALAALLYERLARKLARIIG